MPTMRTRFYLYRLTPPDGKSIRDDFFRPALLVPDRADRHRMISGERVTLWDFELDGDRLYGVMYRSQTSELTEFLSDKYGQERAIPLNEEVEEGVTGKTHFLYVPDYDIIVIQGGRRRVGPGLLVRYFSKISGLRDVDINPSITVAQSRIYRDMRYFSSIVVTVERPDRGKALEDMNAPEARIIREAAKSGADHLVFKLTRGRSSKKKWLDPREIQRMVQNFLKISNENVAEVTSIQVKGAPTIDDQLDEVDLIQHRMKHEADVAYDDRGLSTADSFRACREAYERFEPDIEELYERRH